MEHTGLTQRPPAYAELLVDSLDRYTSAIPVAGAQTTSSDWQTILQQVVLNGYFTRLAVSQIQFHWNLPTIITGYNDTIRMIYQIPPAAPVAFNLVIPAGWYTPDELATAIENALVAAAAPAGFTVIYNETSGSFTIGTGAGVIATVGVPAAGNEKVQARAMFTTGLYSQFGAAAVTPIVGAPPSMVATRYVDICSSTLTKFQRVKDTTTLKQPTITNIIARVYPVAPNTRVQTRGNFTTAVTELPGDGVGCYPFTICIDYNTPKYIKWDPNESLSNFDLQLRDEFGELLPYSPGDTGPACEYQLTILATES